MFTNNECDNKLIDKFQETQISKWQRSKQSKLKCKNIKRQSKLKWAKTSETFQKT